MPGPGGRAKAAKAKKNKQAQSSSSIATRPRDAYVNEVDDAEGWTAAVNILCVVFELPGEQRHIPQSFASHTKSHWSPVMADMTTRRGLKKIHNHFDEIYKKLDTAYQRNIGNERIRGGIVGIYAKMCVDSLLRNKLFERGTSTPASFQRSSQPKLYLL